MYSYGTDGAERSGMKLSSEKVLCSNDVDAPRHFWKLRQHPTLQRACS
jgi:hypothetical protein